MQMYLSSTEEAAVASMDTTVRSKQIGKAAGKA